MYGYGLLTPEHHSAGASAEPAFAPSPIGPVAVKERGSAGQDCLDDLEYF